MCELNYLVNFSVQESLQLYKTDLHDKRFANFSLRLPTPLCPPLGAAKKERPKAARREALLHYW